MKIAIIRFPGSNCEYDIYHVLKEVIQIDAEIVWHREFEDSRFDAVILPGGFSYGDYLRAGIIAAHSPATRRVKKMAKDGKPVLGICNGFQILIEAELLPGALLPNINQQFVCKWIRLRCENYKTPFTQNLERSKLLFMPIAHQEGRYFADELTLKSLVENGQIVFRYVDESGEISEGSNPNGSLQNIAGICNLEGNVVGMMPHPERASEQILSKYSGFKASSDGLALFLSLIRSVKAWTPRISV